MTGGRWDSYADRFAREYAEGADLEGEARFVDVLADRGSRVLDAGCGIGRTTAALHRMGHLAVGVDRDAGLVAIARDRYPDARYLTSDLLALTPAVLRAADAPDEFDVVVLAGNVMVYLAPGTEPDALRVLTALVVPGGRIVTGFATDREYTVAAFDADAAAAGLVAEHRFATWHLAPWTPDADWAVTILRRGG